MGLKDINFKEFLLQKGEKVGLWVAGGIMAILIVLGVVQGLTGGSSDAEASKIKLLRDAGQQKLNSADPPEDIGKIPEDLKKSVSVTRLDSAPFALDRPWFSSLPTEDNRWRKPDVLSPDEFDAVLVRVEVPSVMFSSDMKGIYIRVPKEGKQPTATGLAKAMRNKFKGVSNPNALLRQPGMGGTGAGGTGGGMSRPMGGSSGPGMPGTNPGAFGTTDAGQNYEIRGPVSATKAEEENREPAKIMQPYRMAVVSGAFPLNDQIDLFRSSLRYHTKADMLNDKDEIDPNQPKATIEFRGMNVKRRTLDLNGKVVQDWAPLDIEAPYTLMRFQSLGAEPENPDWLANGIIVTMVPARPLVMPLPLLYHPEQMALTTGPAPLAPTNPTATATPPSASAYPPPQLPSLDAALKTQIELQQSNFPQVAPRTSKFDLDKYDPYKSDDSSGGSGGPGGMGSGGGTGPKPFGSAMPGAMGSGFKPGSGSSMGGFPKGTGMTPPGSMGSGGRGTGMGVPGSTGVAGQPGTLEDIVLPARCLVRFIDLTVEPGRTYEYQVQIKMANPVYNKKDLAVSEDITQDPVILGDFKLVSKKGEDGKEKALQVSVSDETLYYAVDDRSGTADKATMQIHRWLERVASNPNDPDTTVPVGEWIVRERTQVQRGEPIGRREDVEIPNWDPKSETFTLMAGPGKKGPTRPGAANSPKVPVDLDTGASLVDFEGGGGKRSYTVATPGGTKSVPDEAPLEALVLTADGKVVVHNSRLDSEDQARKDRADAYRSRIDQLKGLTPAGGTTPGGDSLFGPSTKPGGT